MSRRTAARCTTRSSVPEVHAQAPGRLHLRERGKGSPRGRRLPTTTLRSPPANARRPRDWGRFLRGFNWAAIDRSRPQCATRGSRADQGVCPTKQHSRSRLSGGLPRGSSEKFLRVQTYWDTVDEPLFVTFRLGGSLPAHRVFHPPGPVKHSWPWIGYWTRAPADRCTSSAQFDRIQSYIEENPVRAGLVSEAHQHPWSSAASRLKGGCGQDWPPHKLRRF